MYEWLPISIVAGTFLIGVGLDAWEAGYLRRLTRRLA